MKFLDNVDVKANILDNAIDLDLKYEPVITKLTGFNKSFGTIAGTVSEGDHTHMGTQISRGVLNYTSTAIANYVFAETPADTLDYDVLFRITITSTVNSATIHSLFVRVVGNGINLPNVEVSSSINSATTSNSGIRFFRVIYPKTALNGYKTQFEFATYNATSRDIRIELVDAKNVSLLGAVTTSVYNATYQNLYQTGNLYYNGNISANYYGALTGNASTATYAYSLYNNDYVAGEALVANDLVFLQTDSKWYKATTSGVSIPTGTIFTRVSATFALGVTVGGYVQGTFPFPTGVTGLVDNKDVFVRGQLSGGAFISDGTVTTTLTTGYSYVRLGIVALGEIAYDGNNRIYTILNNKLDAVDGFRINIDAVITQGTVQPTTGFWFKEI